MFLQYLSRGDNENLYFANGGSATVQSYRRNLGDFHLPAHHEEFFTNLKTMYETDTFIAVHAGLDPAQPDVSLQIENDLMWIREKFYRSDKRWEKTIIFGHTPTIYMASKSGLYIDNARNIIGIDNGVVFNRNIICLKWPELATFESREGANYD
jgi:serine/threonine protein phosphatase 1